MAFDGTENCWKPNKLFTIARERRMRIAQFGDGYEQRIVDGLHSMMTTWSLTFDTRPQDVILDMDAYLAEQEGHAFPFLDPVTGLTVQVFCDQWSYGWELKRNEAGASVYYGTLNADFREAFGETLTLGATMVLNPAEAFDAAIAEAAAEVIDEEPRPGL